MWRLCAVIAFIAICYNYPSGYSHEYLELDNLKENTARSLYLCFGISLLWSGRSALAIIGIEALLILCNFYTGYNMPSGGVMNKYYSLVQQSAYYLELLIMITFIISEWRKSGEDRSSNIHGYLLRRRVDHHRSGNSR